MVRHRALSIEHDRKLIYPQENVHKCINITLILKSGHHSSRQKGDESNEAACDNSGTVVLGVGGGKALVKRGATRATR